MLIYSIQNRPAQLRSILLTFFCVDIIRHIKDWVKAFTRPYGTCARDNHTFASIINDSRTRYRRVSQGQCHASSIDFA